jgi:HlyD family secretion protein
VVTYVTVVAVSNPDLKLKPGMTANVKILVARHENALLVPNAAFRVRVDAAASAGPPVNRAAGTSGQRQASAAGRPPGPSGMGGRGPEPGARGAADGQQRLWVLRDGKPVEQMVRTGLSDGQKTEIVDGLREGETVIVGQSTQSRNEPGRPGSPRLRL